MADSVAVTFRVDLRPVLRQFRTNGRYEPPEGPPIAEDDFEGVAIRGTTPPFGRRPGAGQLRLTDPDDDGVYRTTIVFDRPGGRGPGDGRALWSLSADLAEMPAYTSDQRLVDALYNRAMETVLQHRREGGGFRTGERRNALGTQELGHSTLLSLALIDPEGAKASLLRRVQNGRIAPDPGLGGGWPVSADRMVWALAAWEVFKTTGDTTWLQQSYDVIRRSADADLRAAFDEKTGLFYGGSPFPGEDEHLYPAWMQPTDVYRSPTLRTNVVHYRTYRILAQMATVLGKFPDQWARVAQRVKQGVNEHLWQSEEGRYAAYRYGRTYHAPTQRTDALGNALVVLSGITGTTRARRVAQQQPIVDTGVPVIWPSPSDESFREGTAPRSIVNAYWTWASAAAQNTPGVEHGLASLYRAATLADPEARVKEASSKGDGNKSARTSLRVESASGLLASVYRVLFGMRVTPDGLTFTPFVPAAYSGTHTLTDMPYRDATLTVTMKGHGTRIVQVTLDGRPLKEPVIPPDLTGAHEVQFLLSGGVPDGKITAVDTRAVPPTPVAKRTAEGLAWNAGKESTTYRIFRNGAVVDTTTAPRFTVRAESALAEYQVQGVGEAGDRSFRSEPIRVIADTAVQLAQPSGALATDHDGYTGDGYRRLLGEETDSIAVTVPTSGSYALDLRYANGHGSVHTGHACAVRAVRVNGERVGTAILPPRGTDAWTEWGYSNVLRVFLTAGTHTVILAPDEAREQRHTVHLDHLRVTPLPRDDTSGTP
jgi:hypothetical protein